MADDMRKDYLVRILAAHRAFYDIKQNYSFEGRHFPAYAEFHTTGEKYVLVKRAKLWEVNTHDYMFFEIVDHLDEAYLAEAVEFITAKGIHKVHPDSNHMSSALTLIIIASQCSDEAFKRVKTIRFRKNFCLSLKGWSDLRLAVADLSRPAGQNIVTNAKGKQLKEVLAANLALMQ